MRFSCIGMRPERTKMGAMPWVAEGMRQLLNQIGICRETMPRRLYHFVCLSIQNSTGVIRTIRLKSRPNYRNVIRRELMCDELSHRA
jgi:hypothetical protein